jgi:GT2 family glycosyltransferase
MNKIGMVILNFLTYDDTYNLLYTLNEKLISCELEIYIVDNQTNEEKYNVLKEKVKSLSLQFKLTFLSSSINQGFARGMNIGINQALKDGCKFIICSNNDIYFKKEISFDHFINIYINNRSIGVIGPKIINNSNINENPYMVINPIKNTLFSRIKYRVIFSTLFGKYLFFLRGYLKYFITKDSHLKENVDVSQSVYCLHGSFFVLTPAYLNYYQGLDPNTFLYCEELILAKRIKQNNLIEYYIDEIEVCHKDDSSTDAMLGKNSWKKIKFILTENYKSLKYYMKEYIWRD